MTSFTTFPLPAAQPDPECGREHPPQEQEERDKDERHGDIAEPQSSQSHRGSMRHRSTVPASERPRHSRERPSPDGSREDGLAPAMRPSVSEIHQVPTLVVRQAEQPTRVRGLPVGRDMVELLVVVGSPCVLVGGHLALRRSRRQPVGQVRKTVAGRRSEVHQLPGLFCRSGSRQWPHGPGYQFPLSSASRTSLARSAPENSCPGRPS
jgi:hypothetical protein